MCTSSKDGTCQNRKADGTLCGAALDAEGRHATMCCCGGGAIARHNALRDTLALLARERSAHVDVELDVDQAAACPDTGAWLDLAITHPGGGKKTTLVDVAVASPYSQLAMRGGPGHAALLADKAKQEKYCNVKVTPAIWETLGRPGNSTVTLLRQMAPQDDPGERTAWLARAWRLLGTVLQTYNSRMVHTACWGKGPRR